MSILVIAEHDNVSLKGSTLNTITAANSLSGDVTVFIAGSNISDVVSVALKSLGVSKLLSEDDVVKAWNQIMPTVITENTRPTGYRNGMIEVSVLQPSIHYTLDRQMKPEIVKKLQSLLGREKVKGIIFRVG